MKKNHKVRNELPFLLVGVVLFIVLAAFIILSNNWSPSSVGQATSITQPISPARQPMKESFVIPIPNANPNYSSNNPPTNIQIVWTDQTLNIPAPSRSNVKRINFSMKMGMEAFLGVQNMNPYSIGTRTVQFHSGGTAIFTIPRGRIGTLFMSIPHSEDIVVTGSLAPYSGTLGYTGPDAMWGTRVWNMNQYVEQFDISDPATIAYFTSTRPIAPVNIQYWPLLGIMPNNCSGCMILTTAGGHGELTVTYTYG